MWAREKKGVTRGEIYCNDFCNGIFAAIELCVVKSTWWPKTMSEKRGLCVEIES